MKKLCQKISLKRESLQILETPSLRQAAAGAWTLPPVCENTGNC